MSTTIETLTEYGNELADAGFEVWLTRMGTSPSASGYLQYRDPATGAAGSLQQSGQFGEFIHLMPIVPSRTYGSSMHLDTDLDPWTVEAARECAQLRNRNSVVGWQDNAGDRTWRSPDAIRLHGNASTRLTVTINSDDLQEVARILTEGAQRLQSIGLEHARPGEAQELFSAQDANGNTVGAFTVTNLTPAASTLSRNTSPARTR